MHGDVCQKTDRRTSLTLGVAADDARGHFGIVAVHALRHNCVATAVAVIKKGERRRAATFSTALRATGGTADDAVAVDSVSAVTAHQVCVCQRAEQVLLCLK